MSDGGTIELLVIWSHLSEGGEIASKKVLVLFFQPGQSSPVASVTIPSHETRTVALTKQYNKQRAIVLPIRFLETQSHADRLDMFREALFKAADNT